MQETMPSKCPKTRTILLLVISILTIKISPIRSIENQPTNNTHQGSIKNCSYSIEIETTCAKSADTKDKISLRFSDSAGNSIIVKPLKNPKLVYAPKRGFRNHGGFERCAIEMFEASGTCMKESVCSMHIKNVGSDDRRPAWIKVLINDDQEGNGKLVPFSYVFYFRIFVLQNVWYGFDYCHSKQGFKPQVASFGIN